MTPEICPNCDEEVPEGALACPSCGADERTGWSDSAHCDRLGIPDPDEEFDYEAFVKEEFSDERDRPVRPKMIWMVTAVVVVLIFLLMLW